MVTFTSNILIVETQNIKRISNLVYKFIKKEKLDNVDNQIEELINLDHQGSKTWVKKAKVLVHNNNNIFKTVKTKYRMKNFKG